MMRHIPVLLKEALDSLRLKSGDKIIDCTLGDGGHAEAILEATAPDGRLLGIDADPEAILRAKQYLYRFGDRAVFARSNFDQMKKIVADTSFGPAQGIIFDLGWSSTQFGERGRGFSFNKGDEPLDMRYATGDSELTAAALANAFSKKELEKIFREYGEEKLSREIAREIAKMRKRERIERVGQLADLVINVYRRKLKTDKKAPWVGGLHPATRVFQAMRIAVNDELGALERVLPQAIDALAPGGRLAIIAFHSLEDRIVKHFFKNQKDKVIGIITKRPIVCGDAEYAENPPARSAKLRVAQKL